MFKNYPHTQDKPKGFQYEMSIWISLENLENKINEIKQIHIKYDLDEIAIYPDTNPISYLIKINIFFKKQTDQITMKLILK